MSGRAAPSDASPDRSHFRADIQGLRGLAVLLVIVFHSEVALPGGFVGVDVFFVISGFVIAGVLVRESSASGRVSLPGFYARRVRRLLPALACMTIISLVVSVFVLSPDGTQQAAAKTAGAASLSVANLQLYLAGGQYFGTSTELNPFLHTWSLSVEEQFYLVLPGVFALAGWLVLRRRNLNVVPLVAGLVATGTLVSVAASVVFTSGGGPLRNPGEFAFYSPLTRAWEFGVGVLLALLGERVSRSATLPKVLAAAGVAAIAYSAVSFGDGREFPGYWAALPVLGTAAVIHAGTTSPTVRHRLGWRPLARVGDLAYSWYLWHWPFIVFARVLQPDSRAALMVAAVLSLGPAWLSYTFVEQPIRGRRGIVGARALVVGLACALVPLVLALVVNRVASATAWGLPVDLEQGGSRATCLEQDAHEPWQSERCLFDNGGEGLAMLLGDSHAGALQTAFVRTAAAAGMDAAVWARATCPLYRIDLPDLTEECERWQDDAADLVRSLEPDVVVIANRSPLYAQDDEVVEQWGEQMRLSLDEIRDAGAAVVLVATVPEYPEPPGPSLLNRSGLVFDRSVADVNEDRGEIVELELRVVEDSSPVIALDPVEELCDTSCSNVVDGSPIYSDEDHLNSTGTALLEPALLAAIREARTRR